MSDLFKKMMTGLDEVEGFLAGETTGYKVTVPAEIDVKVIRKRLNMTQSRFSDTFGFSLDAVKHWEGGRRTPEASTRAFLTVIAKNPGAVIKALHPNATNGYIVSKTARVIDDTKMLRNAHRAATARHR